MKHIPDTHNTLVVRTDFSDAATWESMCAAVRKPVGAFKAHVDFISDPQYDSITIKQLLSFIPQDSNHTFRFIVDSITSSHPEHPILVADLYAQLGRTFRAIPSEMWSVENNLSIANMEFEEFAKTVNEDGFSAASLQRDFHYTTPVCAPQPQCACAVL